MVILTLLGGLSVAVAAQDTEADPMAPAFFTFDQPVMERVMDREDAYEEDANADELPQEVRGQVAVGSIEATDPRASGRVTSVTNMNMTEVEGGGVATVATMMRLVNDGGAWSGTALALHMAADDGGVTSMTVLTGEGGYDGLTLIMGEYYDDNAQTRRGVIVPSDQIPPMPDPIAPAAEQPHRAASAACRTQGVLVSLRGGLLLVSEDGRFAAMAPRNSPGRVHILSDPHARPDEPRA